MSKEYFSANIVIGQVYTFKQLENILNGTEYGYTTFLRVFDVRNKQYAMMVVCGESLSDAYRSGDGILFYSDGEQHSSNNHDEYKVMEIVPITPEE